MSAHQYQVGGNHYADHKIQPWDIVDEYGLDFYQGSAIKYILRDKAPHTTEKKIQDLKKAIHCLEKEVEVLEQRDVVEFKPLGEEFKVKVDSVKEYLRAPGSVEYLKKGQTLAEYLASTRTSDENGEPPFFFITQEDGTVREEPNPAYKG